jgi:uncharacterized membrane protein YadS
MAGRRINWQNVTTVGSVAILVGTELVGLSWAAGWALGGMFGLSRPYALAIEIACSLGGLYLVAKFVGAALNVEPIFGPDAPTQQ